MKPLIQVCLFGSLREILEDPQAWALQLDVQTPTPLPQILRRLKIPLDMIQVVMVNFRAVFKDCTVEPGDRISLFPREYPVFADWKDFRLPR